MRDNDNAFWAWSKCLGELIFWAREPDAETTTRDGWREAFRNDNRDKGDRALDAAPDDVTRNQVIRSRSLASDLVRMLNTCCDLNSVPCRNWPTTERNIVEELTKLKSLFAELGDGGHKTEPATVPANVAAKPEATLTATPAKSEGAVSLGVFTYNGKREENIPPAPWRLLEFMENKSEADIEEAYQHAIDEHDKDSTPGAIKGMLFKANQVLLAVTHPKQLSKARGVNKIVWV